MSVELYKSETLPHWRFRTEEAACESAEKIYAMFLEYEEQDDLVGIDMARKVLQVGWTRARRYATALRQSARKRTTPWILRRLGPPGSSTRSICLPARTTITGGEKRSGERERAALRRVT